jgi:hypothetical protein
MFSNPILISAGAILGAVIAVAKTGAVPLFMLMTWFIGAAVYLACRLVSHLEAPHRCEREPMLQAPADRGMEANIMTPMREASSARPVAYRSIG